MTLYWQWKGKFLNIIEKIKIIYYGRLFNMMSYNENKTDMFLIKMAFSYGINSYLMKIIFNTW